MGTRRSVDIGVFRSFRWRVACWLVCSERWLGGWFAITSDGFKLTVLLARLPVETLMEGAAGSSVVVGVLVCRKIFRAKRL